MGQSLLKLVSWQQQLNSKRFGLHFLCPKLVKIKGHFVLMYIVMMILCSLHRLNHNHLASILFFLQLLNIKFFFASVISICHVTLVKKTFGPW